MARTSQDLGVPVFTYAVGAGPLTDETDCAWVRTALSDAVQVTVRDEESKLVLEEAGLTRPVTVTADPALLLEPGDGGEALLRTEAVPPGVRLVGMSVREPGRAAEHLDEEGYHRVMPISMATGQAAGVCAALAATEGRQPRDVPASAVQRELRSQGASLR